MASVFLANYILGVFSHQKPPETDFTSSSSSIINLLTTFGECLLAATEYFTFVYPVQCLTTSYEISLISDLSQSGNGFQSSNCTNNC